MIRLFKKASYNYRKIPNVRLSIRKFCLMNCEPKCFSTYEFDWNLFNRTDSAYKTEQISVQTVSWNWNFQTKSKFPIEKCESVFQH